LRLVARLLHQGINVSKRDLLKFIEGETKSLKQAGLIRHELVLDEARAPLMRIGERDLVNFTSRDYLGFTTNDSIKKAAIDAVEVWGVGVASARAATGTLALHRDLERAIAKLIGTEDALIYASGHHANAGLFEALLGDRDYVFCDEMVRPSLADGIRLSRARGYVYRNCDMDHLEDRLKRSRAARFRIIATEGVFPVTGQIANLEAIYALASKYRATVVVDDSEGVGILGDARQGSHGAVPQKVDIDIVTGSFGCTLGGGGGGFVAAQNAVVAWLRQTSRGHLASTALAPSCAAAALACIEQLPRDTASRAALDTNLETFKAAMAKDAGLLVDIAHPAVSILVRSAVSAQRLTDYLYRNGFFVIGYCYPVVPESEGRISLRVTARHTKEQLERVAKAIGDGMKELQIQL
jgi:glycine C-acetyltransferase